MPLSFTRCPRSSAFSYHQLAEIIAHVVEDRLRQDSHAALRSITCEYHAGTATLRGTLPSVHLKQLAQDLALQTRGVRRIVNRIEVAPWEASDEEHRQS